MKMKKTKGFYVLQVDLADGKWRDCATQEKSLVFSTGKCDKNHHMIYSTPYKRICEEKRKQKKLYVKGTKFRIISRLTEF